MESLAQLNANFFLITFSLLFLFSWILAIAAVWVFFRAGRDLHRIANSLELERAKFTVTEVDHASGSVTVTPSGRAVVNSAFGR